MNYNYVSEKKSDQVKELAKILEAGKSPEAKKIEALIKTTEDTTLKEVLENRLSELEKPTMSIDEIKEDIHGLGYSLEYIIKLGLGKLGNQLAWQEKQAEKKSTKE